MSDDVQPLTTKPNKKRISPGRLILIIVLVIIVISIISSLGGGSKKSSSASTSNSAPTTTPASITTSANTVVDQIAAWNSKYGSIFNVVGTDMGNISKDATANNVSAVSADCQKLLTDVTTAQGYPAIPESTVEQHWSSALSYLSSGSQDCIQAVKTNDTTLLSQATSEFSQGNTQITDATSAIAQAAG